ncbi:MAG TPA: hypothetical protein VHY21_21070 [Pseudonocardiaceae bacterium]|jgi:hypothetical protein|nr:hypothetical protein [Pseudonocardiaceae bacterium]
MTRAPRGGPHDPLIAATDDRSGQLQHLTVIEHHPESVWIEVPRVPSQAAR